jgi:toxin ParE1/3/4
MALEIIFAPAAQNDVDSAARYLEARNPEAAVNMLRQLDHTLELMGGHPFMGPVVSAGKYHDMRKITMPPYAVYYRVLGEVIEIVRMLHHAQESERRKL